jgi:dipeptidyl aminopeptidase/acylaminoacyl peptidase
MPVMTACALICMIVRLAAAAEVTPGPAAPSVRETAGTQSEAGERTGSGATPAEKKAETAPPGQEPGPAAGAETRPEEKKPEPVEPLFVRPLRAVETGRNDSNPVWSPSGTLLAFERSTGDKKEIQIALSDGTVFQAVSPAF